MFEHLGKKAGCSAFYTKAKDGINIEWNGKNGDPAFVLKNGVKGEMLHFEGDGVIKTLYKLVNKKFDGVCVGEITLPITELLFTDIHDDSYSCYPFVGKEIKQSCECYIVYYANNMKHYVPKDCCEFLKGGAE